MATRNIVIAVCVAVILTQMKSANSAVAGRSPTLVEANNDTEGFVYGEDAPRVRTTSGFAVGAKLDQAHAFYEIPYAIPPTGNLRFKDPVAYENTTTINAAENDYTVCYQKFKECFEGQCFRNLKEDCLVLNVFVPMQVDLRNSTLPPSERLPVLFYIHGGSFLTGAGTEQLNDGRWLSNVTNSVVVTINYRLGIFGFLVYGEGNDAFTGNQGLKDQRLAMKWVQDNIEKFGGDKNKVTLFGNSAGAQSILFHLVSSVSEPLFHRAILQSQSYFRYQNRTGTLETTDFILSELNCTENSVQCLRATSPEDLVNVTPAVALFFAAQGGVENSEPFRPYIDGSEFTDQPLRLFRDGLWQKDKAVIIGTTVEEFHAARFNALGQGIPNAEAFEGLNIHVLGNETGRKVAEKYQAMAKEGGYDLTTAYALETTHGLFTCHNRALARMASATSTRENVYLYTSDYKPDGQACLDVFFLEADCGTSYHASELMVLFRSGPSFGFAYNENDTAAADQFSTYWGNFAWSGNPSSGLDAPLRDVLKWPAYVKDSWYNIQIQPPKEVLVEKYLEEICDFWDDLDWYPSLEDNAGALPRATLFQCFFALLSAILIQRSAF